MIGTHFISALLGLYHAWPIPRSDSMTQQPMDRGTTLLGLLGVMSFSLTLPATKFVVPVAGPWFAMSGRAAGAGLIAAGVIWCLRPRSPTRHDVWGLIMVIAGVVIGFPLFSGLAMMSVDASHGAVVVGVLPLATAMAGTLLAHERQSWKFWTAGGLGSMAIVAYTLRDGIVLHPADGWLLLAVVSAAIGYAEGGRLARRMGGWQVIAWALVWSLPLTGVAAIVAWPVGATWSPAAYGGMAYLILVSQFLGFVVWYRALARGGIARVGQLQLLQPCMTIAVSVMMMGERPTWLMGLTLVVVLGCVAYGRRCLEINKA